MTLDLSWPSERLVYWYFRLNGFLTIEDFVVHPDSGSNVRTDVDILAARFANRSENSIRPMEDDGKIAACKTFANIILAEVTTDRCKLNGPWTKPEKENIPRVLRAIGCVSADQISAAAKQLYERGSWSDSHATVRLFAIGEFRSDLLIPHEQQVVWSEIISFCIRRFEDYSSEKSAVGQWPEDGRKLKEFARGGSPESVASIRKLFRLGNSPIGRR